MIVTTRVVWDWSSEKPVLLARTTRGYVGPVGYVKGASKEQNALAAKQSAFYDTLQSQQAEQFANQKAIFASIRSVYDPIFKAGPNQYGFNNVEDAALRTQAGEGTAANYQMASKAAAERSAAAGGGNSVLPSGVQADIAGKIAATAAADISNKQLGITTEGYNVGRQNFQDASRAEFGVASGYNPLGYASEATRTGDSAFNMATEIQKANAASSPWGAVGGLLGGIAGSFAGPLGASIGSKVGGFLGNAGSSNRGSSGTGGWNDATAGL